MKFTLSAIKAGLGLRTANFYVLPKTTALKCFLTGDQTLTYEEDLAKRTIAIVALSSVEWEILKDRVPLIVAAIDNAIPGSFQTVDCGAFTRRR